MSARVRLAALFWLGLTFALVASPSAAAGGNSTRTGSGDVASGGACPTSPTSGSCVGSGAAAAGTDEAQLAEKYAPIVELKRQSAACANGEPYLPAPVDIVLGDPDVVLRRDTGAGNSEDDPIVARAPTVKDLSGKGSAYYLDLPGDQRSPGCDYEHFFKERMGTRPPLVYAHIATESGHGGIALQYWFYYVFNRFNDLHEGDWEMIQLSFDAPTAAAALTQEPAKVAFAQHEGGEVASWDDHKLSKDGDHPIVYIAAGSHAAYYGSHSYLGWGEQGSGLGCDDTRGPSVRVPLQVQLVPDRADPTGSFAWLTYRGRWGAKDSWVYAGPDGPNMGEQWTEPFSWQEGLRKTSLALQSRRTIGPDTANIFCQSVAFGAGLWTVQKHHSWITYGMIAILLLIPTGLVFLTRDVLGSALALFVHHAGTFLALGAVLAVLGTAANQIEGWVRAVPGGNTLFSLLDLLSPVQFLFQTGSSLQQFVGWALVTPAVVFAVGELDAGRQPGVRTAYRAALAHFGTIFKATARAAIVVFALLASVVGIPWAGTKVVRYVFLAQAVMLEGTSWRAARTESEWAVVGRWWRTAALVAMVGLVLAVLAPLVGVAVLIFVTPSVVVANAASGLMYALLFPLIGIVMTIWYQQRRSQVELADAGLSIGWPIKWPWPITFWDRVVGHSTTFWDRLVRHATGGR